MLKTALDYSHHLLKEIIQKGDTVVDATVGNGYDTLFLAQLVGKKGKVYGFDIQPQAIEATQKLVTEKQTAEQVMLSCQGHETIGEVLGENETISAAAFNLGYLPKGDKKIVTQPDTTIQAIKGLLPRLKPAGRIALVIYYGHSGGMEEKEQLLSFSSTLPQKHYNVLQYQFLNQKNTPPILLVLEKRRIVN